MQINELLKYTLDSGASDLHLGDLDPARADGRLHQGLRTVRLVGPRRRGGDLLLVGSEPARSGAPQLRIYYRSLDDPDDDLRPGGAAAPHGRGLAPLVSQGSSLGLIFTIQR